MSGAVLLHRDQRRLMASMFICICWATVNAGEGRRDVKVVREKHGRMLMDASDEKMRTISQFGQELVLVTSFSAGTTHFWSNL